MPAMTVLIGNMGDTVIRVLQETTDWTGRKTVLPEYQEKSAKKQEGERGEVNNDHISLQSNTRIKSDLALASVPAPYLSPGRTLPEPLASSSGEGQEVLAASKVESSLDTQEEEKQGASDPYDSEKPQQTSKAGNSSHNQTQVQAEARLLAREISRLAKDMSQQPPKKYGWEEWVNWLKILGDEGRKTMDLDHIEAMNLSETVAHRYTRVDGPPHKNYRRYNSQPNPHEDKWHWTWLGDKGPLFSPQTETEWILSKLCSRLEHLMQ